MNSTIPPKLENNPVVLAVKQLHKQGTPRSLYVKAFNDLALLAYKHEQFHDFVAFTAIALFCAVEQEHQQQIEEDAQSKRMSPFLN